MKSLLLFHRFLVFAGLAVALLCATTLQAEDTVKRPDYSGRWKMVKEQSDFAKFKMPDMIVRVVEEHGMTMNIHSIQTTDGKTSTSDVSYYLDGREAPNTLSGRDAMSKAFWDGPNLTIRTETKNSKGQDTQFVDRWELSEDGQTLTVTSHVETTSGEADLKLVCQKEKPSSAP